jgi:hypothetical protein
MNMFVFIHFSFRPSIQDAINTLFSLNVYFCKGRCIFKTSTYLLNDISVGINT